MSSQPLHRALPVVGITGAAGTGKSQVASLFKHWGGSLISGDEVGKDVVDRSARLRLELAAAFGGDILRGGQLKRALLAQRAFASPAATDRLNQIVHPRLLKELNLRIHKARRSRRYTAVVVDAALLAEWGPDCAYWDCLIGVWAPLNLRQQRLRARGWSEKQITALNRCQMSWAKRRAMVDFVVKNDASLTQLEYRARLCWQKILSFGCGGMS
jgi:dephospho-CoA kinase